MKNLDWPLLANAQISEYLEKSIVNNNIGGAYIFAGPDNLGKTTIAKFLAQVVLCKNANQPSQKSLPCQLCPSCLRFTKQSKATNTSRQSNLNEIHGDFRIINKEKDKKNISIKQVREFIRMLNLSSFGGNYKIGVIKHAESLSANAANALLKTLEEPKEKVLIILITQSVDLLPSTIVSRSRVLNFKPVSSDLIYKYLAEDLKITREKARDISKLCLGRPALAMKFLENNDFYSFYNEKARAILDMQKKDINGRLQIVDSLLDRKVKGQEAVRIATRILDIWQAVLRDILLLSLGHNDIIQHIYLRKEIEENINNYSLSRLLKLSNSLFTAHNSLRANVSPHLVFEGVALNI